MNERQILHVHADKILFAESLVYAWAEWANDCERRLLGLHCGQMLERSRHLAWAKRMTQSEEG